MDSVVQRDGKVVGVKPMAIFWKPKVVILADGGILCWLKSWAWPSVLRASHVARRCEGTDRDCRESVIEDRFQLQGSEGAACLFAGAPTDGLMGGGFLAQMKQPFPWGWSADFII